MIGLRSTWINPEAVSVFREPWGVVMPSRLFEGVQCDVCLVPSALKNYVLGYVVTKFQVLGARLDG